jgi:hypothetical protein
MIDYAATSACEKSMFVVNQSVLCKCGCEISLILRIELLMVAF